MEDDSQQLLFPLFQFFREPAATQHRTNRRLIKKAHVLWAKVARDNPTGLRLSGYYEKDGTSMIRLVKLLETVFSPLSQKLKAVKGSRPDLTILSLLSWTSSLSLCNNGPRVLFTEIPVLSRHHRLGGWRVDALEVLSIDGRAPSRHQKRTLRQLSQYRFISLGHLIRTLKMIFGEKLQVTIWDWKFAIGDGPMNEMLDPAMTTQALPEHVRQMERYLTLARLELHLATGQKTTSPWDNRDFTSGRLVYLFPNREPLVEEVTVNQEQCRQVFDEEVVMRLDSAEQRATLRMTTNLVGRHVLGLWNGNGATHRPTATTRRQPTLFSENELDTSSGHDFARKHRKPVFLPGCDFMEIVGRNKDGQPRFELHLDRLIKAIERGEVEGVQKGNDWNIRCPLPDHNDSTPSFIVYTGSGDFHCFGCRAHGNVALESIPPETMVVTPAWRRSGSFRTTRNVEIPEEHRQAMAMAQECLTQRFINSPAETYLQKERGLDPEIALGFGAGYGSDLRDGLN
jgi:hypothetical protein